MVKESEVPSSENHRLTPGHLKLSHMPMPGKTDIDDRRYNEETTKHIVQQLNMPFFKHTFQVAGERL